MKRVWFPSLLILALIFTGCRSSGSLGKAKSLWRNGEPEALDNARLAARNAPPEKAVEAALLVCKISLEVGNPKEALNDYEFYIQRLKRHDRKTLRSVAQLVFIDALNSWSIPRRCKSLESLSCLSQDQFAQTLIQKAARDPAPEVRAAAILALVHARTDFFEMMLDEFIDETHPLPKAALLKVYGERRKLERSFKNRNQSILELSAQTLAHVLVTGSSYEARAEAMDQLIGWGELESQVRPLWPQMESALKLRLARYLTNSGSNEIWPLIERDYPTTYLFRSIFGLDKNSRHNLRHIESLGLMAAGGSSRAKTLLEESLTLEKDIDVLIGLTQAARCSGLESLVDTLDRFTKSKDPELRSQALLALEALDKDRATEIAKRLYKDDPHPLSRCNAFLVYDRLAQLPIASLALAIRADPIALAAVGCERLRERGSEGTKALALLLDEPSSALRNEAVNVLGAIDTPDAIEALQLRFKNGDAIQRRRILPTLSKHGLREFLSPYVHLLRNGDDALSLDAATAILNLDRAPAGGKPNPGP
ncbi:MAG: hypothetical protein P1V97_24650 [Planctomycetota bacterium]|nr:hypothetical protein [Planctomycetota bacterium]